MGSPSAIRWLATVYAVSSSESVISVQSDICIDAEQRGLPGTRASKSDFVFRVRLSRQAATLRTQIYPIGYANTSPC
ncbi:hypothetical protein NMY22_g7587 [Coprinellus aureogranulatus]|nr:hypothetical protein NMY22_g7587 [Coprinellus aureogranulatus]